MEKKMSSESKILSQYFKDSIIPQLHLDSELILRDFTPTAKKLFSLNKYNIGKSVFTLRDNIKHKAFIENIRGVLATERVLKKKIEMVDKRKFQLCLQPFFTEHDEVINGIILTYIEIIVPTSLIERNKILDEENQKLKEILLRGINFHKSN